MVALMTQNRLRFSNSFEIKKHQKSFIQNVDKYCGVIDVYNIVFTVCVYMWGSLKAVMLFHAFFWILLAHSGWRRELYGRFFVFIHACLCFRRAINNFSIDFLWYSKRSGAFVARRSFFLYVWVDRECTVRFIDIDCGQSLTSVDCSDKSDRELSLVCCGGSDGELLSVCCDETDRWLWPILCNETDRRLSNVCSNEAKCRLSSLDCDSADVWFFSIRCKELDRWLRATDWCHCASRCNETDRRELAAGCDVIDRR